VDGIFSLLNWGLPSFFSVVAVLVLLLVLKDADRPPVRVVVPAPDGGWRPLAGPGMPPVYWHVRISWPDVPFDRRFGTLCLMESRAWFVEDYPDSGVAWQPRPVGAIAGSYVERRPLLSLHRGDVDWWIDGRPLRLVVSRSRINRWVDNDIKELASRADAHTFVSMLIANGARLGSPPRQVLR
jgi:hypothetical protein